MDAVFVLALECFTLPCITANENYVSGDVVFFVGHSIIFGYDCSIPRKSCQQSNDEFHVATTKAVT